MILTNCFLSVSICLGLVIRSYWFSIPSLPLLPLQLRFLLLKLIVLASEVVSTFCPLFSRSSSLLPSHHVIFLTIIPAGTHCPWDALEAWTQDLASSFTSASYSAYPFHVLFSLPRTAYWHLLFLGVIDFSHTFTLLEQIFATSRSLPWFSMQVFFILSLVFLKLTKLALPQASCKLRQYLCLFLLLDPGTCERSMGGFIHLCLIRTHCGTWHEAGVQLCLTLWKSCQTYASIMSILIGALQILCCVSWRNYIVFLCDYF